MGVREDCGVVVVAIQWVGREWELACQEGISQELSSMSHVTLP